MKATKTKRVKTAFSSNSQLCHVFAQQKQESGRTKNLFFENTTDIYSYGHHFLAAKVHNTKKGRVVLVNSRTYSSSTGKQLSNIRSAFHSLEGITLFCVPVPRYLEAEENIEYFDESVINAIDSILTTVKVTSQHSIDWAIERLAETVKEANTFFDLIKHKKIVIPSEFMKVLEEHLKARHKRTLELNEGLEARQKLNAEKTARKFEELKSKLPELKELWRKEGKPNTLGLIKSILENENGPGLDFFRVIGDRVLTSRGASVSLKTALKVVRKLINGTLEAGEAVEHFHVSKVSTEAGTVKIGCHCFNILEAVEVLRPFLDNGPKLVNGENDNLPSLG